MKISVNSWHYRTANKFDWQVSNSLCVYFWQVVWGMIFWWIVIPVILTIVGLTVFLFFPFCVGKLILDLFDYTITGGSWVLSFKFIGVGYLVLSILFALLAGHTCFVELRRRSQAQKSKKEDSLFVAYIKAKKRKICPIIDFKE